MVDPERAVSYVQRHGDAMQLARLCAVLWCKPPSEAVLHALEALRAAGGGYRRRRGGKDGVAETACVLGWIDDLGLRRGPSVDPGCRFLIASQREDGGWGEPSEWRGIDDLGGPLSTRLEARAWLTGRCVHVLIRFGYAEAPGTRCPTDFLLARVDKAGRIGGSTRATEQALPMLAFHPGPTSPAFGEAIAAIEKAYSADRSGGRLGALLGCLHAAGLPSGHPLVLRVVADLDRQQRPDGSFTADPIDGREEGVEATIAALRALRGYGRL